ncbi:MAG: hypothetical protein HUN04_00920 [Desulfobacter sp.]|nr:MAG: hypothetical protein HUN04_00920 [Desulfobacter sp.]
MAVIYLILVVPAIFFGLYLAAYIRYEIKIYRYYRKSGYDYSPCWFRIWVRLSTGTAGAADKKDINP